MRTYSNTGGTTWNVNTGWAGNSNHCSWEGITCSTDNKIVAMNLVSNGLSGNFPTDLNNLGSLESLDVHSNDLVGTIPADLCDRSTSTSLHIYADSYNCPQVLDSTTGQYVNGCCDDLVIDVGLYLSEFATVVLGDATCSNLGVTEGAVCNYMTNQANHDIFANGFPTNKVDIWDWLKVCMVLNNSLDIDYESATKQQF